MIPIFQSRRPRFATDLSHRTAQDELSANDNKDKKCPFVGSASIRGRILTGRVVSTKMHRTIIIRREFCKPALALPGSRDYTN